MAKSSVTIYLFAFLICIFSSLITVEGWWPKDLPIKTTDSSENKEELVSDWVCLWAIPSKNIRPTTQFYFVVLFQIVCYTSFNIITVKITLLETEFNESRLQYQTNQ